MSGAGKMDEPPRNTPSRPPSLFTATRILFLLGAIGISYYLRARVQPVSYALCSAEGERIYTVDDTNSVVQCVLVHNSRVVHTGSLEQVSQRWKHSLSVRYIKRGSIVVPGLSDSHAHILEYGASRELPLEGTKTIQETVERVRNYILSNPDVERNTSKFILGGGWDHTVWPASAWPSAADLDSDPVIRGRPVVLQSKDCHALWVSSKALEVSQPFPSEVEGGVIVRDTSGNPTGMLLDNAQELIKQPALQNEDLLRRFNTAVRDAVKYGLTSIHDAGLDPISLAFFKRQAKLGKLPVIDFTIFHCG
ncbi:hypothetical protein E1B28_009951 [Marasmius oreades]|uniref:Amidohydrolase 3 domain-containing protein n=1 Tax=Marasmius oreades TaxID=181124 RepID=A0A9P7RWC3_9AGAR|nr:uncharacterized protein E1B28_009951 [Marasmius oreades]KAG7090870.1 hypothetical protein E1B28_009951 [Marasmius oreades]